jgi:hypothetical protein
LKKIEKKGREGGEKQSMLRMLHHNVFLFKEKEKMANRIPDITCVLQDRTDRGLFRFGLLPNRDRRASVTIKNRQLVYFFLRKKGRTIPSFLLVGLFSFLVQKKKTL